MGCCHSKLEPITTVIIRLDIMAEPINFLGLIDEVVDEDSAIQFLQNDGLLHENRHCPRQDHVMGLNKRSRKFGGKHLVTPRWRCHVQGCRSEVGVRCGTFFEGSNLPLRKVTLDNLIWIGQSR